LSRGLLLGAVVALAFTAVACGLFETRKPNDSIDTFPCLSLDQQGNVFQNLRVSFGRRVGTTCYLSNFDDSFVFTPDPTDEVEAAAGQFANWNKNVEQQVAQSVAANATDIAIDYIGAYELVTQTSDLEIRRYRYEIHDFKAPAIPDDSLFQGIAEFTIERKNALWVVTKWVDGRDPNGTTTRTWGYLRGSYRTGF